MKQAFLVLAVLAMVSPAWGQEDRSWHLLTQSEGGSVSLLKDLTKHECEFARHRALRQPATDQEVATEKKRSDAMWDEARDICAHPNKYQGSGGHVDAMCDANGNAIGLSYGGGSSAVQPRDIRSAECFQ